MSEVEEANNPETPAARLRALASLYQEEVSRALTQNPNTPKELLYELGEEFPVEFLRSPLLQLMYLESPEFLREVPVNTLCELSRQEEAPEWLLVAISLLPEDPLQDLVREGPPERLLRLCVGHPSEMVKLFVAIHTRDPNILTRLADDPSLYVRQDVARNKQTPIDVREKLALDASHKVRDSVASNNSTPAALLHRLVQDPVQKVRECSVWNQNITVESLLLLSEGEPLLFKRGLLRKEKVLPGLLEECAAHEDRMLRSLTAGHPSTPVSLLEKLASDPDEYVRGSVSQNPNISQELLMQLAKDTARDTRENVARHSRTTLEALARLSNDPDEKICRAVINNPKVPIVWLEIFAKNENDKIRAMVARNPRTPVAVVERLFDDLVEVRWGALMNPMLPLVLLEIAAVHPEAQLRRSVAENPAASTELLHRLQQDPDKKVRIAARSALTARQRPT